MKIIKVADTVYDIRTFYKNARTPAQRALLGYIIKGGFAHDPIFGGAFALLCDVELCKNNKRIYKLITEPDVPLKVEKQIIYIAEAAMNGEWDEFALNEREINYISRRLSEYL